jgi:hypothetical protein
MAGMTRSTRGICTGGGAVLVLSFLVGCAQSGQNNRQTARPGTPQPVQAAPAATPVQAAANAAGAVVNAATGAVTGAVNGAVNGAAGGAGTPTPRNRPRAKPNGRGGFDSSELQQAAIKRSHAVSARYGVTKVTRARNGVLAGGPTTRPTSSSTR